MPLTVSTLADDNETPTPLAHSLLPDQVDERVEASSEKAPAEEAGKEQAGTEKSRKPRHPHLGIVRGGSVLACAAVFAVLTLTGTPLYKPSFAVPTSSLASTPVIALSTLPTMAVATATPFARLSIGSIACTKSLSVTHQCEAKRKCDLAVVAPATQPKVVEAGPSSAKGKTGTEIALTEAWDATVADIRGYLRVQAHILRTARLHQAEAVTRASSYALSLTRKATRKATKQYIRSLPKSLRTAVRQERKRVMKRAKRGARKLIRRDNKALAVREADRVETMGKPAQCKARRKHQHTRRH